MFQVPIGTEPGTVIVETPDVPGSYVTTTQPWTGVYKTTYTVPPSGTIPGTVIIETPFGYFNTSSISTKTDKRTITSVVPCSQCSESKTQYITPTGPGDVTVIISQPPSKITLSSPEDKTKTDFITSTGSIGGGSPPSHPNDKPGIITTPTQPIGGGNPSDIPSAISSVSSGGNSRASVPSFSTSSAISVQVSSLYDENSGSTFEVSLLFSVVSGFFLTLMV
ncbi:Hypothetical protein PP7435_CHR4-1001 [Komagataella phaffii CBS 7435]|uniref:Uncharacterized protein n=1 Tax=Komagataella phaffii (strain ATCC 76273 / CBS 7435 / CECT 11047 / NRRL Y-11430 / Wegner 21-1) TaxID=981350 RepID=F2R0H3_KOMPC|nr:Hypothetical protein BQ9382_C4-5243 [Komagataella phaffii CBS 7435]CCA41151.1 Hypothetical protein PP7435_CHR4-1001 [Komagataella phaffii CBS 7435]